jgi:phage terminase large subunit-like protein
MGCCSDDTKLENMGFTVVPFGQGFKDMSPPTKELMNLSCHAKATCSQW